MVIPCFPGKCKKGNFRWAKLCTQKSFKLRPYSKITCIVRIQQIAGPHSPEHSDSGSLPSAVKKAGGTSELSHSQTLQSRRAHIPSSGQKGQSQYRLTLKYLKNGVAVKFDSMGSRCLPFTSSTEAKSQSAKMQNQCIRPIGKL